MFLLESEFTSGLLLVILIHHCCISNLIFFGRYGQNFENSLKSKILFYSVIQVWPRIYTFDWFKIYSVYVMVGLEFNFYMACTAAWSYHNKYKNWKKSVVDTDLYHLKVTATINYQDQQILEYINYFILSGFWSDAWTQHGTHLRNNRCLSQ